MDHPGQKQASHFRNEYANSADFCGALRSEMGRLYVLAFLLSANHEQAERYFIQTVQEIPEHNAVFKAWVGTWARHALIKNAIRGVLQEARMPTRARDQWWENQGQPEDAATIEAITRLAPLDRFVFVMSVLERYSAKACSVLLDCAIETVIEARLRAFETLGSRTLISTVDAASSSGYLAATV